MKYFAVSIKSDATASATSWIFGCNVEDDRHIVTRTVMTSTNESSPYKYVQERNTSLFHVFPKRDAIVEGWNECESSEAEIVRINYPRGGMYTGGFYKLGTVVDDQTFWIKEKVALWDNNITGYHALEHDDARNTLIQLKTASAIFLRRSFKEVSKGGPYNKVDSWS